MINQEFKALERKYQVLPNFGICSWELKGAQRYEFLLMCAQFLLCLVPKDSKLDIFMESNTMKHNHNEDDDGN